MVKEILVDIAYRQFVPHPLLTNGHAMTIAAGAWPRRLRLLREAAETRLFEVEPGVKILAHCHWQPVRSKYPTLVLLHGLEGSSQSHYMLGTAEKAYALGMNVVRMNHRNCGDSLHLTPTLYNSGMSGDPLAVVRELRRVDKLNCLFLAGWSMGGNVVLKAAAELGDDGPRVLSGVCAVSPALDLETCVKALESGANKFYQQWFLNSLKKKLQRKSKLFPHLYDPRHLKSIKLLREFDDIYTAPGGGYGSAERYYKKASALPVLPLVRIPALIIQSRDDPFVPFESFLAPELRSPYITVLGTEHGGHCGFVHICHEGLPPADRFWAENRIVDFCLRIAQHRR